MKAVKSKRKQKNQVAVLISPIFLVVTEDGYGIFRKSEIKEGNELRMYYVAYDKITRYMSNVPEDAQVTINIILNRYDEFSESELYMVLLVIKDILDDYRHLKVHFFDEKSAREEEIIC